MFEKLLRYYWLLFPGGVALLLLGTGVIIIQRSCLGGILLAVGTAAVIIFAVLFWNHFKITETMINHINNEE